MMGILYGQPEPLNRLREPLRDFVRQNILQNQPATEENIEAAVNRVLRSLQPDLHNVCVSCFLLVQGALCFHQSFHRLSQVCFMTFNSYVCTYDTSILLNVSNDILFSYRLVKLVV